MEAEIIKTVEYININDNKQCISVRTKNINNPILLYLHGGPGDAALPLVAKYNKNLEDIYTVVTLEQRGSGKSYYPFSKAEELTISTFIDDIYSLVLILLKRFKQSKLYLVGHSWGSVLGMQFIQLYPELVHAYIGCGQVVNMKKSCQEAHEYAINKNKEAGKIKMVAKLEAVDVSYQQKLWLDDLLFVTGQVVKFKGSLYGKKNYNRFILDFFLSSDYRLKDLINRQKGSLQSIKYLWPELMTINFENVTNFKVPIIFVEGRHDKHVSSLLAYNYYETIQSQKLFYWFEKSCHFPQWSEPERFYEVMAAIINDTQK
ncbi:alpha/beta hydrolase [Listeria ivanovii]|uniref:AB hydrolase-1 domain-containing protein n=1 Tax=Listeria ivanovii (strain ATCC BAA-678 / PAM 55) TaxID=881621 RepID=G2ZEN3_LISIP|nr:alpha/beta hydrolase [Listeria ivanovii]AHI55610.1 alpha/beta hydrolase [Listeria ivanovii WSLC3009]MCJ1716147.1 alpha/beta hydrolase [Listeria ivanovii]MCJ1721942.1 alpha/beta hydrolase [Listeria ivanovii]MCJ1734038.1 alpha/beta hydrolase [Listeria ivanovii]CBW85548.1 Hypothetical protein LIV_1061 [Listeria ivanovii subsp. ivanovii PAM 55]